MKSRSQTGADMPAGEKKAVGGGAGRQEEGKKCVLGTVGFHNYEIYYILKNTDFILMNYY